MNTVKVFEIDSVLPARGDRFATTTLSKLPRLIAADVDLATGEVRQVPIEQLGYKLQCGIIWVKCRWVWLELTSQRMRPALGTFR